MVVEVLCPTGQQARRLKTISCGAELLCKHHHGVPVMRAQPVSAPPQREGPNSGAWSEWP
eukprot:CAMPEP_0171078728 /NCGR_PEP_ID=MMETSP0766_2-20121228/14814_1 /TAXON_ID=439317 /ORGANISM="Gambierdiscus australes, Strain CAWD 149" /LENGTH=59 /DNA_ID=CAMNT_0011535875 /DNA_START=1 /DNA_END=176 /DNA_ORIENTATION=-